MITRRVNQDGSVDLSAPGARALVIRLAPGVVFLSQAGQNDSVTLALFDELTTEIRRSGSLRVFADARGMKRMTAEVREKSLAWAKEHRAHLGSAMVLVESKLMDMALSVLAMLIGGGLLKSVSVLADFEAKVREHAPHLKRLPELEPPPAASADAFT